MTSPAVLGSDTVVEAQAEPRINVVAVVLGWRGRIALFKRSELVRRDKGRWHCVTGYVEDHATPTSATLQALCELHEETGLGVGELCGFSAGSVLDLEGGGRSWRVHTFWAETTRRRLELNWEHVRYRWVRPDAVVRFAGSVPWLPDVLGAVESCRSELAPSASRHVAGCGTFAQQRLDLPVRA